MRQESEINGMQPGMLDVPDIDIIGDLLIIISTCTNDISLLQGSLLKEMSCLQLIALRYAIFG